MSNQEMSVWLFYAYDLHNLTTDANCPDNSKDLPAVGMASANFDCQVLLGRCCDNTTWFIFKKRRD